MAETANPQIVKMKLYPAAEPRPALKYQLLPTHTEQNPGDGLSQYYALMDGLGGRLEYHQGLDDKLEGWIDVPAEDLPLQELRRHVDGYFPGDLACLDRATRCETCHWNLATRVEGASTQRPSLRPWRLGGYLNAVRARLAVADGRFDDAICALKTGFSMAGHVGDNGILWHAMTGINIANASIRPIEDMLQTPGSPNLYWALANLPLWSSLWCRGILQGEREMLYVTGLVRDIGNARLTPEQWEDRFVALTRQLCPDGGIFDLKAAYQESRQYLLSHGYTEEQVQTMTEDQVMLLYMVPPLEDLLDEAFKWWTLPYWQGIEGLEKAHQRQKQLMEAEQAPLFATMVPDFTRGYDLGTAVDKRIASLQCIEAIRMYAAAHEGRLPATLAEITEVPVPRNPMTGKDFDYRIERDTAILDSLQPSSDTWQDEPPRYSVRYELTICK